LDSSVSIVSDYRLRFDPRQRQRVLPLASVSRPDPRPTQHTSQWVQRVKRGRGVTWDEEWVEAIMSLPLSVCMAVAEQLFIRPGIWYNC
jgi:hypothetical protein